MIFFYARMPGIKCDECKTEREKPNHPHYFINHTYSEANRAKRAGGGGVNLSTREQRRRQCARDSINHRCAGRGVARNALAYI